MAKLTLTQKPTFPATVKVPVLGGGTEPVEFTFKAKRRTEFEDWMKSLSNKPEEGKEARKDEEIVLGIASGWDLEEKFDKKNLVELFELYPGSARAIVAAYIQEYTAAKSGN